MINLIPPAARKIVKREYWVRVLSVWMILAATAFAMITLLKIPVYVLVNSQMAALSSSYESATADDLEFKKSQDLIKSANQMASLLVTDNEHVEFSEVINRIDSLSGEEVFVNSINMARVEKDLEKVTVRGEALTRAGLAGFKERLENDEMFLEATLPLSNLAKDVDIPFSIEVTLTNTKENDT